MSNTLSVAFDNTYANQLAGFYAPVEAEEFSAPAIVQLNRNLAVELGLNAESLTSEDGVNFLAGQDLPQGAMPLAQVYSGHQFGNFSPRLGDGRALLLGEVLDENGFRRDIQLKGSGKTPFSRGGDGKAALGPVLREYLMGEAMHALGVPTTRALAALTTGDQIYRDALLPGAVLVRVAASHIRVGTFQYFASQGDFAKVRQLADYAINRHDPDLANSDNKYLEFLRRVIERQARLVAKWMSIGFIHGVMNTDNVAISGETIDYGPCAFMDTYDPATVFSSIDQNGRYAYSNQPIILNWNLARFAESILTLIDADDTENAVKLATDEIVKVQDVYQSHWLAEMRVKLGLENEEAGDLDLAKDLHKAMEGQQIDFTNLFRSLSSVARGKDEPVLSHFQNTLFIIPWLERWKARLKNQSRSLIETSAAMVAVNPFYIPRNHKVEEALAAAQNESDYEPFEKLLSVVSEPFDKRQRLENYAKPAPTSFGRYRTFCGT